MADQFQFVGGSLAVDFVNTVGNRLTADPRDYFQAPDDLRRWVAACTPIWPLEVNIRASRSGNKLRNPDLRKIAELRERIYSLLVGVARGLHPDAGSLRWLGDQSTAIRSQRTLAREGRLIQWKWKDEVGPLERLRGSIIDDTVQLLTSSAAGQLRQCTDAKCGWLFVDTSQGHRRRWCSMRDCGNRAKASRFYQRHASKRKR